MTLGRGGGEGGSPAAQLCTAAVHLRAGNCAAAHLSSCAVLCCSNCAAAQLIPTSPRCLRHESGTYPGHEQAAPLLTSSSETGAKPFINAVVTHNRRAILCGSAHLIPTSRPLVLLRKTPLQCSRHESGTYLGTFKERTSSTHRI